MRLGFGFLAVSALVLSACTDDRAAKLAASWGCGPIEGLAAVSQNGAPGWVLIGEVTETNEIPAATADIACNLATDGQRVFVGVSQYLGGDTSAEAKLLATLDEMIAKGAPLIVERIGDDDLPYALRNRDRAEEPWARALIARVSATKAARAVLLVTQADAIASPLPAIGDGVDGQDPKPIFLPGKVVSLEAAASPVAELKAPSIRVYVETLHGFHGELAVNRLTRPVLEIAYPEEPTVAEARASDSATSGPNGPGEIERLFGVGPRTGNGLEGWLERQNEEMEEALRRQLEEPSPDPDDVPPLQPALDLPEFEVE